MACTYDITGRDSFLACSLEWQGLHSVIRLLGEELVLELSL